MAFLALSNLRGAERTASIISAFFAIGSIIIGLHHVWRHRVKVDTDARQAVRMNMHSLSIQVSYLVHILQGAYLRNAKGAIGSVKPLAFFLSLPLILLSWSLVTFTFSVTIYAFHNAQSWVSYAAMGAVLFAIVGVVAVTVLFFWEIFSERSRFVHLQVVWDSILGRRHRNFDNSQP